MRARTQIHVHTYMHYIFELKRIDTHMDYYLEELERRVVNVLQKVGLRLKFVSKSSGKARLQKDGPSLIRNVKKLARIDEKQIGYTGKT